MSAQNTLMTAVRAAEVGAYDYMPKPFDLEEMLGGRERALRRPRRGGCRAEDEPARTSACR